MPTTSRAPSAAQWIRRSATWFRVLPFSRNTSSPSTTSATQMVLAAFEAFPDQSTAIVRINQPAYAWRDALPDVEEMVAV